MIRRRKLTLLIGGTTVSLSGCLSGDNSTGPTREEGGKAAIDSAEESIDEAIELITAESSVEFARQPSEPIQTGRITRALDDATIALDRAADSGATATDQEIQPYRTYTKILRSQTSALGSAKQAIDTITAADVYRQTKRYEDAVTEIHTASELLTAGSSTVESARVRLEDLDIGSLNSNVVNRRRVTDIDNNLTRLFNEYQYYTSATVRFYRGLATYWTGVETYNQARYNEASAVFNEASNQFDEAKNRYKDAERAVSPPARTVFIEQTCVSESMYRSSEQFVEAALAAQRGDTERAEEYVNQATTTRNHECDV
ncbi:hypothetical protein [Halorubrum distributum]|uniref:hypothetical protein n=1 Tax=Halorubrum distributum TaxID=29283 RepID=UPI0012676EE8|nr:hypothetical protein [Halorubrum litoreum]